REGGCYTEDGEWIAAQLDRTAVAGRPLATAIEGAAGQAIGQRAHQTPARGITRVGEPLTETHRASPRADPCRRDLSQPTSGRGALTVGPPRRPSPRAG